MASVGFRIFETVPRPARELVEQFRGLPVANISDNMNRMYAIDPAIRPLNRHPLLGTALTVHIPSGDNMLLHYALDLAQPGDVLVVSRGNSDVAFLGSLMARKARNKGLEGIVIDGCVRDSAELAELEIPVYARGISPRGPYKNGPGEVNVPIAFGGQVVFPGDIVIGDEDGLIAVRPKDAEEVLKGAWAQNAKEVQTEQRLDRTRGPEGAPAAVLEEVRARAAIYNGLWSDEKR